MSSQSPYPQSASEMLAAMARMYNYDLSSFESILWSAEVLDIYDDREIMLAFKYYMENGEQSRFMPKYGEIKRLLEEKEDVTQKLLNLVSRYGSYSPPSPKHTSTLLLATIEHLGGWAKVCSEMPDSSNELSFAQYVKRTEKAAALAKKNIQIRSVTPNSLVGRVNNLKLNDENVSSVLSKNGIAFSFSIDRISHISKVESLKSKLFTKSVNHCDLDSVG